MSVSNGQKANETNFNNAFPSRSDDTSIAGQVSFQKVTDSTSPITGGVTMDGGLGVAKNLNVGGVFTAVQVAGAIKTYTEQIIASGGTSNFEASQSIQYRRVKSNGGNVVLSTTPLGNLSTLADGAMIILVGTSDTDTPEIKNNDIQYGALVFGVARLKKGYMLTLLWDAVEERLYEFTRNF